VWLTVPRSPVRRQKSAPTAGSTPAMVNRASRHTSSALCQLRHALVLVSDKDPYVNSHGVDITQ